jgi:hypothetical protein
MYNDVIVRLSRKVKMEVTVINNRTGQRGVVRGFWYNIAGQMVLNVRVNGIAASWLAVGVTVLTEKAA